MSFRERRMVADAPPKLQCGFENGNNANGVVAGIRRAGGNEWVATVMRVRYWPHCIVAQKTRRRPSFCIRTFPLACIG